MNKNDIGVLQDKKKVWEVTFLCLAVILSISMLLNGCSLANPELQDIKKGDQLIGVFVTYEEDLKDYRMQEGDTLYYQEKKLVRADGNIKKLTDKEIEGFDSGFTEEGIKQADGSYSFGEIDGYYLGYEVTKENIDGKMDEVGGALTSSDVYAISTNINEYDEESNVTISGTIAVPSEYRGCLNVNCVYKRADGSVYIKICDSAGIYIQQDFRGGSLGHSVSESVQSTIYGNKKERKAESRTFTVTIEQTDFLNGAIIKQMDAKDNVILETPETFDRPESEFLLDDKTAYVIVEESLVDEKGQDYIKRTAYDCENIRKNDEEADTVLHTFHYTDQNGKITLFNVTFVR